MRFARTTAAALGIFALTQISVSASAATDKASETPTAPAVTTAAPAPFVMPLPEFPKTFALKKAVPLYAGAKDGKPKATLPAGTTLTVFNAVEGGFVVQGKVGDQFQMGIAKAADLPLK